MDSQAHESGTPHPRLTMDQCYLVPYGVIGVLSDLLSLYIAVCLAMSRRPLYPKRKIRHQTACHAAGVFVLISYWSVWKENIVGCLPYWQLILITYGNATMGLLILIITWVMFTASNQKDAVLDATEPEASVESEALLVDHDTAEGPPSTGETDVCPDAVTPTSQPASGRNIHRSVSNLVSAIWKESSVQAAEEIVPGHENEHQNMGIAVDAEAQKPVDSQAKALARFGYFAGGMLGSSVICSLVGSVALAVESIEAGSNGAAYLSGFFTLVFLEIIFLFCVTFLPSTPVKDRYAVRVFLIILCGAVTIVYSDFILGIILGSIAGVPFLMCPQTSWLVTGTTLPC